MDQKALDDAYDQLVYAPNRDQVHKRNMFNSDRVRARLGAPKRLAYGAEADRAARSVRDHRSRTRRSTCSSTAAPGGRARSKDYAFLAEMYRARRRALDRRSTSTASRAPRAICCRWPIRCGARVAWVYKNAKSFGGDPNRIYVSGQSSGAHLAGMRRDHRLEGLRRAERHREGRAALLGHVRPQAGAAVEALATTSPSPTRARRSCRRSAISTGSTAR